jgi:mono/diheme cytochrome c family protein
MRQQVAMLVLAVSVTACAAESSRPPSGEQTFVTHCASCHGAQGEGDGPAAAIMRVTVPNLRTLSRRNDGVFPADSVAAFVDGRDLPAAHGDRYMPIWGDVFGATERLVRGARTPEERIRAVVDHLRELQYP